MIPYYPIINEESMKKFEEYKTYIQNIKNLHLLGRLGLFKYINIDVAVEMALNLSKNI
jgi:UDP-galactopyranose mutase